jgi:hypothetical protein
MCLKNTSGNPCNRQEGIGDTALHRPIAQAFTGRLLAVMARLTRFKPAAKSENSRCASVQHAIYAASPGIWGPCRIVVQIIAMPPFTCSVWPVM